MPIEAETGMRKSPLAEGKDVDVDGYLRMMRPSELLVVGIPLCAYRGIEAKYQRQDARAGNKEVGRGGTNLSGLTSSARTV